MGYLTILDFYLAEALYYFEYLFPSQRKNYNYLWRIRANFEALPGVQAYYSRKDAIKEPFLPPPMVLWRPTTNKVRLGYWDIRGLAQVSRLLLAHFNVEVDEVRYDLDNDRPSWS